MGRVSAIERERDDRGGRAALLQRRRILSIWQNRRHLRLSHAFGHSPLSGVCAGSRRRGGNRGARRKYGAENDLARRSLACEKSKGRMGRSERRQSEPGI